MSSETKVVYTKGVGLPGLLGVLFIGLKLAHVITWPWWIVVAPLWVPAAVVLFMLVVSALTILLLLL